MCDEVPQGRYWKENKHEDTSQIFTYLFITDYKPNLLSFMYYWIVVHELKT
jgi:hypothetical protein